MAINMAFVSGKGGVGKTSIVANLATFAARYGIRTLIVDCDVYTLGATVFFETGNNISYHSPQILSFKNLLEDDLEIQEDGSCREKNSDSAFFLHPLSISKNLDLIPAKWTGRETEKYTGIRQKAETYEKTLYRLMAHWDNVYELVIYDLNAGFYDLQHLIIGNTQKIVLVREKNLLSKNTSQEVFDKIMRQFAGKQFYDCINKHSSNESWPDDVDSFLKKCLGFSQSQHITRHLEAGKVLNEEYTDQYEELGKLTHFLLPEFAHEWKAYDTFIEEQEKLAKLHRQIKNIRHECLAVAERMGTWCLYSFVFSILCVLVSCAFVETPTFPDFCLRLLKLGMPILIAGCFTCCVILLIYYFQTLNHPYSPLRNFQLWNFIFNRYEADINFTDSTLLDEEDDSSDMEDEFE